MTNDGSTGARPPYPSSAQKALGAIGALLGCAGLLFGVCGSLQQLMTGTMFDAQRRMIQAQDPAGAERFGRIIEGMEAVIAEWTPYVVTGALLNAVASSMLVAAGVFMWKGRAQLRGPVLAAGVTNAFVDSLNAFIAYRMQSAQMAAAFAAIGPEFDDAPARVATFMDAMIGVMSKITLVMVVVMWLAKVGVYVTMNVVARDEPADDAAEPPLGS